MTTEEKAKAYDEALRRAKDVLETDLHESGVWAIKKIFPELKESEDEKIRKGMIRFLNSEKAEGIFTYEARQSWIAYLEKQKINTEGDFGRGYDCGYKACLNSHGAEFFEKQKEQKMESCDCSRDEECYINGIHHVLMNPEAYGLTKQKPVREDKPLGDIFEDMNKTMKESTLFDILPKRRSRESVRWEAAERNLISLDGLRMRYKVSKATIDAAVAHLGLKLHEIEGSQAKYIDRAKISEISDYLNKA